MSMCVFVFVVCIVIVLISIGFCIMMRSIFGGVLLLLIKIYIHLLIAILSHRSTSMFVFIAVLGVSGWQWFNFVSQDRMTRWYPRGINPNSVFDVRNGLDKSQRHIRYTFARSRLFLFTRSYLCDNLAYTWISSHPSKKVKEASSF